MEGEAKMNATRNSIVKTQIVVCIKLYEAEKSLKNCIKKSVTKLLTRFLRVLEDLEITSCTTEDLISVVDYNQTFI